ncbi:hypothetical protein [Aeromicrobium chenweiae]|uniref:Leucine rich repeat variant domain-containing protein n=1 Tax=Aeromicrobium chenweiae TaxID=2079793 RepID=A0A2S0WK76_9ACTN|nr:hypothetical protein [Aeromicrobium chenweiae]AWB91748.1 hypothetical protein C3E78_05740 [Aeromicrobium chenweiae]TGN32590.1 hypothetical protein E4L97_07700 [Aeromicrobium chenweiae]
MASEDLVREAQDPSTTPARLAELAQADRALWPAIAVHPQAYPGLLEWLGQQGDATVSAVLALRSSSSAATPTPTEVIPSVQPSAQQPSAEQPTSPVAEPVVPSQPTSPVAEPVVPSQPAEQAYQPAEPTQSFQPAEPTQSYQPTQTWQPAQPGAVYAAPNDGSYGSVPPGGAAPLASQDGDGNDGSKKKFWLLAGMVAVVILLIGGAAFGATKVFGGDDDDDKDEASSSQTKDADETPEPEPTEVPTADAPTATVPTFGSDSGSSDPFCTRFKDLQQETLDSMGSTSGGGTDLNKLTDSLSKLAVSYAELEDVAPSQVKSEVAVMADYFDTFKDPTKVDPSKINGKITEFTEAAQKVSQYYYQSCV